MPHSRRGFKTRYFCAVCNVPLCKDLRWEDGQSCFDRFHPNDHFPKPYQPSSTQRS
ncbi:hypothetical protein PHMEG_00035257 [Phytophthora megakarya]|uniref:Uncharacterized protein n=1 Tax=Phytophthora megakarya TaxID=4795 RepID=A0A225UNT0_9STRA|nr:hypothetical protein PHMEG_00035257 [Phytophthora megakarya]